MSTSIDCPACGFQHDIGRFSDWSDGLHLTDPEMEYKCAKCEATFRVIVEWEPRFWSDYDSIVRPAPRTPKIEESAT